VSDNLPTICFEYGGRDVWHTDCPRTHHGGPMKHLRGRLPIGDGVVLYEYECTACGVRVFGGVDRRGHIQRRAAATPTSEPTP
jgi:hypothetical protein